MYAIISWITKHRNGIVFVFKLLYVSLFALLVYGTFSLAKDFTQWGSYYQLGRTSGQVGIILYALTSIPGILRRFGRNNRISMVLMMFRRYLGIAMYMFAAVHAVFLRLYPWVSGNLPFFPPEAFQLAGITALLLLTPLFLTSNDESIRRLGVWWDKIHDLTYWIVWMLFFHLILQGITIWSVIVSATAFSQGLSHAYALIKRRNQTKPELSGSVPVR